MNYISKLKGSRTPSTPSTQSSCISTPATSFSSVSSTKRVSTLYDSLKKEWKKRNLKKCGYLLDELKIAMTSLEFLPTNGDQVAEKDLKIAREILEIGVQWSVAKEDIPSFERYMAQLKCYYYDYKEKIPESPLQYELLGLNLLFLLSQNRVADFHTEVELLPADQIQKNPYLKHPLSLEQCLMEGSYNKILQAKCSVPAKVYNFFIDILLQTVRNEIGVCMETAYEKISVKNATKMLNLKSEKEVMDFAKKRDWNLCPRDKYFHFLAPCEKKEEEPFPNSNMVQFAIDYAKELEMIV